MHCMTRQRWIYFALPKKGLPEGAKVDVVLNLEPILMLQPFVIIDKIFSYYACSVIHKLCLVCGGVCGAGKDDKKPAVQQRDFEERAFYYLPLCGLQFDRIFI
jgi:hypothetical protein